MNIFITGGSGFLGNQVIDQLLEKGHDVVGISRSHIQSLREDVCWFEGDLTNPEMSFPYDVENRTECVIHAAALYDLKSSYKDCYLQNVLAIQNLLLQLRKFKKIKQFIYVSTIAVSGDYVGVFPEDELELGQKFNNAYEMTKFQAEKIVRDWAVKNKVSLHIVRPGIIVGDSKTGFIPKVDGPYYFLQFLRKFFSASNPLVKINFLPFPFSQETYLPLVPVDDVARFITALVGQFDLPRACFHVVSENIPTLEVFLRDIYQFYHPYQMPHFFSVPKISTFKLLLPKMNIPESAFSYLYSKCIYERKNALKLEGIEMKKYSDYKNIFVESTLPGDLQ